MSALQKFTLKDIESATNHFADENVIGGGIFGKNYEAQISLPVSGELVDVAVRRLDQSLRLQEMAFDKEISVLSSLKHDNLVSIVGFCYENGEMIIINKRDVNGSLYRHLSSPKLTWMRRLQISVGVASALSYLHNGAGRNYSIVHHNVNCATILLNEKWEAKLSGFEYSMRIPLGRIDIAYEKLGIGTFKSDVFSFGVVLFELLCGTKTFTTQEDNKFQAPLAMFHYENRKLHEVVDPYLFSQMDLESFNKFAETAYYCLKEQQNMWQVLIRLEKALELQQKHDNPGRRTIALERKVIFPNHCISKLKNMETMRIQHKDILLATGNFASENLIVSGGYGTVHKGKLHHVDNDKGYCFAIEGENECEVAIKRILNPHDEVAQEGFCAEIEMLSKCKHSNIITLLGFCVEDSALFLVYDYAPNKSLMDYILNKSNILNDNWAQRIKICIDVAEGLSFLHTNEGDRPEIVHRDIKSANILLGKNLDPKIGDFGLSAFVSATQEQNTPYFTETAGTYVYMDPQYAREKKLKTTIDVYSFGVVLFELLCGRLANDPIYVSKYSKGLADVASQHFDSGTVLEIVDPKIKEATTETLVTSVVGPDKDSVDKFSDIAYQCLKKGQANRPTMEVVIKELQNALFYQENRKDIFRIPLQVILSVTHDFSNKYHIGRDGYWDVYKARLPHVNGYTNISVKRLFTGYDGIDTQFSTESKILMEYKHENIIGHLGYCDENGERIIVYEDTSLGSLDMYLDDDSITWGDRIKICIDIARGLDFLHEGGVSKKDMVIHRDIKSSNILLDVEMKAKIANFGLSIIRPKNQELVHDTIAGTATYVDPQYKKTGLLSKECDIYSFGVVLLEIMVRKFVYSPEFMDQDEDLAYLVKRLNKEGNLDEMVFEGKEKISPKSLTIFQTIAIQCLSYKRDERPKLGEVLIQLQKALEIQGKHLDHLRIRLSDLEVATDGFSDKHYIGSDPFAMVYKAELSHFGGSNLSLIEDQSRGELNTTRHSIVAIKRFINREDKLREHGFFAKIALLGCCKHPNVESLLGFCDEGSERILVFEYASNGSLHDYLGDADRMVNFTWAQRIKVCLDIARGLQYLHTQKVDKRRIIHCNIKSTNILLDRNQVAKISDYGLSESYDADTLYMDPEYVETGKMKTESDIYSFGIVLFEILCGRLASDSIYEGKSLASIARECFHMGTLNEIVDPKLKEPVANIFTFSGRLNQDSMHIFYNLAYKCISVTQYDRPTIEIVINELEKALYFQENNNDDLQISLEDLKLGTQNFSDYNCIGEGGYWKQYEGKLPHANGDELVNVVAKRYDSTSHQGNDQFLTELQTLLEFRHENIIGLVGYCNEMGEQIIVYEDACNGSLDKYLDDSSLTWRRRLMICINVARGLDFLHSGGIRVLHSNIRSGNILLDADWMAKISNLELSSRIPEYAKIERVTDNDYDRLGYLDPQYKQTGFLTKKSDIYSFGVVLFEILCGRLAWAEDCEDYLQSLGPLAKRHCESGSLDDLVFEGIKEHIDPQSLTTFQMIAFQCLNDEPENRPTAREVVTQLSNALELNSKAGPVLLAINPFKDVNIYGNDFVTAYRGKTLDTPHVYATADDAYSDMMNGGGNQSLITRRITKYGSPSCQGTIKKYSNFQQPPRAGIPEPKRIFTAHSHREFSSKNAKWFSNVLMILDISDIKIHIHIKAQFLSPGVIYGANLIFKFCDANKKSSDPMYVNLKYIKGDETLNSYFATWRDDEWMMIELYRFFNHTDTNEFEVLIESLSQYYCRNNHAIYIEGIEFRAISDQVQKLPTENEVTFTKSESYDKGEKLFELSGIDGKNRYMLSAVVLYDSSNVKLYTPEPVSDQSRFVKVIELPSHQVFRIRYKIENQRLSPDTDYMCYLVFKLSDKCRGLHCPVKVKDLVRRNSKETGILYFRNPNVWNLHDFTQVPKQREDGWMEVSIWKFNSNTEAKDNCIPVNLKLISYEGTMSGLIVSGLEFRPVLE